MKTVSICMAYYNRLPQTLRTLESINTHTIPYEIIIVDDASQRQPITYDDVKQFTNLPIKIITVDVNDKWWCNPCIPYNISFKHATGDIILIQNPECYHRSDIVKYCQTNIGNNEYVSFGCYSIDSNSDPSTCNLLSIPVHKEGDVGWYNHSVYRACHFHFTAAISKYNLDKIGGFDERFATGIAYDDNALLYHIDKHNILRRIEDNVISIHQYHYETLQEERRSNEFWNRLAKNKLLFERLSRDEL